MVLFCRYLVAVLIAVVLVACNSTPPLPRDSQSTCMFLAAKGIVEAKNAHVAVQSNVSKVTQCKYFAEYRTRDQRGQNTNAIGNIVIQNTITNNQPADAYDKAYKACMSDPNTVDNWAPPAFTQFEKAFYGISTINTEACPSDFQADFDSYKSHYRETINLAKQLPHFNTANWAATVKLKIPGNDTEKLIIENDNKLSTTFNRIKSHINQKTGWCPNATFTASYPCK